MIPKKYLILGALIGTLVSLDQLTKFLVTSRLEFGQTRVVIEHFFNLTLVYNAGAAFGFLANLPAPYREPFFFILPAITLAVILGVFSRLEEANRVSIYALSFITGGAIGNLIDRARLGHVVDFLDFHFRGQAHFPAFNVADAAITLGVGLLLCSLFLKNEAWRQ